jgi:hypothetical protein
MQVDLFEFEPSLDGGEAGGGGDPAAAAPAAPAPAAAASEPADPDGEPPAAPAQPEFDPDAFQQAVLEEAEALLEARLARLTPPQPGQPGFPGGPIPGATPGPMTAFDWSQVDPYSDEFGAQLGQGIQATIQEALVGALSPVTGAIQAQQHAQVIATGEERLQDMMADEIARNGDFAAEEDGSQPGRELVIPLAETFLEAAAERYGETPRAAEAAIEHAAQLIRRAEAAAAAKAVAQHANHVATLAGAPAEPGSPGQAAAIAGRPAVARSPSEIAAAFGTRA